MFKKIIRSLILLSILLFGAIAVMIYTSPYGKANHYSHKALESSIIIKAPINHVYNILGNSDNARKWSVFVDHISTLNPKEVKDGKVGSIRRCFSNEDETGLMWDEKVIINEANKRRRLSIYNLIGFDLTADNLNTDQIYEETMDGHTKLTFTIFYDSEKTISFLDHLKLYFSAFQASDIFERNLENIKLLAEENENYIRKHPLLKE